MKEAKKLTKKIPDNLIGMSKNELADNELIDETPEISSSWHSSKSDSF